MKIVLYIIISVFLFAGIGFAADPIIFPIADQHGVTFANIIWTTDIAADSRVDYGETTAYGSNVTNATTTTWHKLAISGLTQNTTYHYKVTSGVSVSADYTFTTYANPTGTVKTVGASGKDYTTIQAAADASSAGWTILVYTGDYNETVTSKANSVTFLAQEVCTVNCFVISSRTYNQIKGFDVDYGGTAAIMAYASNNSLIENNLIHPTTGVGIRAYIGVGNEVDDLTIRKNIIYNVGTPFVGLSHAIQVYGNRILIENNDISHCADFVETGSYSYTGVNIVVRNNVFHHVSHLEQAGTEHIDAFQIMGMLTCCYTLFEGNVEFECTDLTGNCHVAMIRNYPNSAINNIISRYNYAYNIDSGGILYGSANDTINNGYIYNNTICTEAYSGNNGAGIGVWGGGGYSNNTVRNNILHNCTTDGRVPVSCYQLANNNTQNYNVAWNTGYVGAWSSPYSTESTYNSLKNLNPLFMNYPYSCSIYPSSPVRDAGGPLSTVAVADIGSGTSLIVSNPYAFQPGWCGIDGDWIAVGTVGNVIQITSIDYGTNTLTISGSISRNDGDSIWLYKKSDGIRVLHGSSPDIGAYEYDKLLVTGIVSGGNGSIDVDGSGISAEVTYDTTAAITFTPASGYITALVTATGCTTDWAAGDTCTTSAITADSSIEVRFTPEDTEPFLDLESAIGVGGTGAITGVGTGVGTITLP